MDNQLVIYVKNKITSLFHVVPLVQSFYDHVIYEWHDYTMTIHMDDGDDGDYVVAL